MGRGEGKREGVSKCRGHGLKGTQEAHQPVTRWRPLFWIPMATVMLTWVRE